MERKTEIRIIVLQRGWVVVGHYWRDGQQAGIKSGANLRRWGSQSGERRGLGAMCSGPTDETVMDAMPMPTDWHVLTEIMSMSVDQDAWTKALASLR